MEDSGKEKSTYNHILKYTGLLGGVQVLYVLISIVRNKLAALLIGSVGMGLADLYSKTLELLGNATNFGIAFSAVRRLSKLYERGDRAAMEHYVCLIRTWSMLTALLGGVLCLLLSPVLSRLTVGNAAHTASYACLSLVVACATLLGGELAILKGLRRLHRMAAVSALGAGCTLLLTVPCYWLWGLGGIVPALVASSAATLLLHLRAATRIFPYRIGLRSRSLLGQGKHLLRLGAAYVGAGVVAAGAEMLVRAFISNTADLSAVGYYAAGFALTVSYARLVFVALDADYFPRLSAVVFQQGKMRQAVNSQIDVLVMLMAPFLILFSLLLPTVIRLLYTAEFLRVIPMVLCSLFYMYFKSVYSPIAYLSLATGDSLTYFLMETAYSVFFCIAVTAGFHLYGLPGAGCGLALSNLFDLVAIHQVYSRRYGFRFDRTTLRHCLWQGLLLACGLAAAWQPERGIRFPVGAFFLAISAWISWRLLSRETTVMEKVSSFRKRFARKE